MSVKVMSWVWDHSQAVGNDRLVLLAIADNANADGGNAFPGHAELVRKTLLSRSTVYACIDRLVELGELEREQEGGGRGRRTVYRVTMGNRPASGRNSGPETVRETVPPAGLLPGETVQVTDRNSPDPGRAYKEVEPSENRQDQEPPAPAAPPRALVGDDDEPTPALPVENAGTILAAYLDWRRLQGVNGIDGRTKGQLARHIGEALRGGHPPPVIKVGLARWHEADQHPSTLPSFIDVAARGGQPRGPRGKGERQLEDMQCTHLQMLAMGPPEGGSDDLGRLDRHRRQAQRELP